MHLVTFATHMERSCVITLSTLTIAMKPIFLLLLIHLRLNSTSLTLLSKDDYVSQ